MTVEKISASLKRRLARFFNWNVNLADTDQDRINDVYEAIIIKYAKWCQRANVSPCDLHLDLTDCRDIIIDYMTEYLNEQAARLQREIDLLNFTIGLVNANTSSAARAEILEMLEQMKKAKLDKLTKMVTVD